MQDDHGPGAVHGARGGSARESGRAAGPGTRIAECSAVALAQRKADDQARLLLSRGGRAPMPHDGTREGRTDRSSASSETESTRWPPAAAGQRRMMTKNGSEPGLELDGRSGQVDQHDRAQQTEQQARRKACSWSSPGPSGATELPLGKLQRRSRSKGCATSAATAPQVASMRASRRILHSDWICNAITQRFVVVRRIRAGCRPGSAGGDPSGRDRQRLQRSRAGSELVLRALHHDRFRETPLSGLSQ